MERLTKWLNDKKALCIEECEKACIKSYSECHKCKPFVDVLKKLADYEDAEEQGLLLRLPCKVGDTVYVLKFEGVWRIIPHQVKTLGYIVQLIENEAIGDFVFLTREEAERELSRLNGNEQNL